MIEIKLEGLKELEKKLNSIPDKLAGKTLRSAALQATTPAFRQMKLMAPVGSVVHKTYKGRLVTPGFLKRSIRRKTYINPRQGSATVLIGVLPEAFYGINFVDRGTVKMTAREWFVKSFEANAQKMVERFRQILADKIKRL